MYYLYILRCSKNKLYIGISKNPERRLITHIQKSGASFTKVFRPIKLVYTEWYESYTQARKREIQIKKWTRAKKEHLIQFGHPTKK